MAKVLTLGDTTVDVVHKEIKNLHLSVYPPTGRVRIAAPMRMSEDTIRLFAISKLGWIKQHQKKIQGQDRDTPREFLDRESHYVWGRRVMLRLVEVEAPPSVELRHNTLVLRVRPGADPAGCAAVISAWYRHLLRTAADPLIESWQNRLGVRVSGYFVQQMKTKWGSCNPTARTIRLNTELAKKSPECLEYVIVHELLHLLERRHGARFIALMDQHMPQWRQHQQTLNSAPLRHEAWTY